MFSPEKQNRLGPSRSQMGPLGSVHAASSRTVSTVNMDVYSPCGGLIRGVVGLALALALTLTLTLTLTLAPTPTLTPTLTLIPAEAFLEVWWVASAIAQ